MKSRHTSPPPPPEPEIPFTDFAREFPNPTNPLFPPDPEGLNDVRARVATDALALSAKAFGKPPAAAVGDFLACLAHWCDRHRLDLQEELRRATLHYQTETNKQGKQLIPS